MQARLRIARKHSLATQGTRTMITLRERAGLILIVGAAVLSGCAKTPPDKPVAAARFVKWGNPQPYDQRENPGGNKLTVNVQTSDQAFLVDLTSAPTSDKPLGRFTNIGNGATTPGHEKKYDLKPRDSASYELWALAQTDASGKPLYELREYDVILGNVSVKWTGTLKLCEKYHLPTPPQVGFKKCTAKLGDSVSHASIDGGIFAFLYDRARSLLFGPAELGDKRL